MVNSYLNFRINTKLFSIDLRVARQIPANGMEKLKKFYFGVLGWKIEKGAKT